MWLNTIATLLLPRPFSLKRPTRRATGKPGKIVRPPSQSIYEDTEFTPAPLAPVKRSVSSVTTPTPRGPAPSQPPPRLGSSPINIKKRLSASLSSGGGSSDPNRGSVISSTGSSPRSDADADTYEPIQDYLIEDNPRLSRISMITDAPSYPAPPPPDLATPNGDDDNDGYTEVNLLPGGVQSSFIPNKEWAELPLKTGHAQLEHRSPEPTNRLSSSPQSTGSPGMPRIVLPPEPETPPPSPPMHVATPTHSRPLSPLQEASEGPKLPPKKQKPIKTVPMTTNVALQPDDNNVYFDHLVTGSPADETTPIEQVQDGAVYFDHLVEPPFSSKQSSNQIACSSSHVTSHVTPEADAVYFDHLVNDQLHKDQRSLPQQRDEDVYELAGPPDEPPPRLPSKSDKPLPPTPAADTDSVYDLAGACSVHISDSCSICSICSRLTKLSCFGSNFESPCNT